MSHVAEALRRARLDEGRQVLDPHDHPWAAELDVAGDVDLTSLPSENVTRWPAAADPIVRAALADPEPGERVAARVVPVAAIDRLHSRTAQQLTALIERVFLPVSGDAMGSVGLAAVGAGVASAPITAALAEELARVTGARVCAIDANDSAPSLHRQFGIPDTGGVSGDRECTVPFAQLTVQVSPNLWVLSGAAAHLRPMLASAPTGIRLARLLGSFDYVLMDLEPAGVGPGVNGSARLVDGVILVIDAEMTRRSVGHRVVRNLRAAGITILGAVLTNRRYPVPQAIYRYL